MFVQCTECGADNPQTNRFCGHCGTALLLTCATCGELNDRQYQFCSRCGVALSAGADQIEGERRQLTVVFCDLVGSTALSQRLDPEDLREVIRAYQTCCADVIQRFQGFIARYMGDGILVYFGYPQAHEHDAERAIRAGLAAVDAVAQLRLHDLQLQTRIGIATGTVVVGNLIGDGVARQRHVVGETLNLAARLQSLAEPDQVVIAASTYRLIGQQFDCRDFGQHRLKGFSEPVQAWQVTGVKAGQGSRLAVDDETTEHTPLIGREEALTRLLDSWESACIGRGQVVLIEGRSWDR